MELAKELWNCLRRVRFLRFVAQSNRATGWNGSGDGSVAVAAPTDTVLTFTEAGSWQPTGGRPLRFINVFRWSLIEPTIIRLEHLRFGAEHPVYLFDLAPDEGGGKWISVRPHH